MQKETSGCWACNRSTSWTSMEVLLSTLMNSAKATGLNDGKCVQENLSRTERFFFSLYRKHKDCVPFNFLAWPEPGSLSIKIFLLILLFFVQRKAIKRLRGKLGININLWMDEFVCFWLWLVLFINGVILGWGNDVCVLLWIVWWCASSSGFRAAGTEMNDTEPWPYILPTIPSKDWNSVSV